ncbi:MAG: tRNA dihydrouridine synthase DusB [Gammaproteobacteria bacterium]
MIKHTFPKVVLAPMAGITDKPFRTLCRKHGAEQTTSEMVSANPALRNTKKSQLRLDYKDESGLKIIQIAGADPQTMAEGARYNVDQGAEMININMGCPAKKVCNVMAGSALLKDEKLVTQILEAVVNAVDVPVTLKIRTGTDPDNRNGVEIARIAELSGIQTLAIHGRTRACAYRGEAEYETIREIKKTVSIPVYANGDISSPQKAKQVLDYTGVDGVMIGRASQGNPWIFDQIKYYLETGSEFDRPSIIEIEATLLEHLNSLYEFYGEYSGLRIARKHIRWYLEKLTNGYERISKNSWQQISRVDNIDSQLRLIAEYFEELKAKSIAA